MTRNPNNTNQAIHEGGQFNGFNVQTGHGPLISNSLQRTYNCFSNALDEYRKVWMLRFDLHLPDNYSPVGLTDNSCITRFFASLKQKINHSQARSMRLGNRVNETSVRNIWCREVSARNRTHFHVAILLNQDAYAFIGKFDLSHGNMYTRIHEAWASALGMCVEDVLGLVHIPDNPTYSLHRNDPASVDAAFHRVSYFSKMNTKEYGMGFHSFGSSRS